MIDDTQRPMATRQSTIEADQPGASNWMESLSDRLRGRGFSPAITWWEIASYGPLIVIAFVMRLWDVGVRAMHHDESLHALYSWNLFNDLNYQHNPMMHGPFQFEANAAIFYIFGDSDVTARLLYVVMGTVLVAMPFLLRKRIGQLGAVFTAALLTISPAMLYFSRFARNDILMAVWAFGLVISMWRYLDEGKDRYLYFSAALMALALATKESAYLVIGTLGLFLALQVGVPMLARLLQPVEIEGVSPPVAIGRVVKTLWSSYSQGFDLSIISRSSAYLLLLITVTLPLWSAFAAIVQDTPLWSWTNLVLAAPEGHVFIGAPVGGAKVIAFLIIVGLGGLGGLAGYRWNWSVWWKSALIFWIVWVLLYTTFGTNFFPGIRSGIWNSLGYWVVQQGEARGGQPWYYYFVITSIYEYLPLLAGAIAGVFYLRKRDQFSLFLVYWPAVTFVLYTIASEKMPWLLVNITLPLIVLSGRFLAAIVERIEWRSLMRNGGLLVIAAVPIFVVLLWQLAFFEPTQRNAINILLPLALAGVLLGMAASGFYVARRLGHETFGAVALVSLVAMMTVRTGWIASYQNGDTPVEMIVYTQTSPDITRLLDTIEETGAGNAIPLTIDQTSGFTWPWAWYMRSATNVNFPSYGGSSVVSNPGAPIVVVHSQNQDAADEGLRGQYTQGERIKHRWWFPESTYRNLTPTKFVKAIFDRESWRRTMNYWLNREGVSDRLGSEDSYVYFEQGFQQNFSARP
jgi:predicted membrane-bound mannosyltransferase